MARPSSAKSRRVCGAPAVRPSLREDSERFFQELRAAAARSSLAAELLDRAIGLALAIAHVHERAREELARSTTAPCPPAQRSPPRCRAVRRASRIATLSFSSRRRRSAVFLPMPVMLVSLPSSFLAIACPSSGAGSALEHGDGRLRSDAADADERAKRDAVALAREAEEREDVLAHVRVDEERRPRPSASVGRAPDGSERNHQLVADAVARRGRRCRRPPGSPSR